MTREDDGLCVAAYQGISQCQIALKAKLTNDPELPTSMETTTAKNLSEFEHANSKETDGLMEHHKWEDICQHQHPTRQQVLLMGVLQVKQNVCKVIQQVEMKTLPKG